MGPILAGLSVRPDVLAFDRAATVFVVFGYAWGKRWIRQLKAGGLWQFCLCRRCIRRAIFTFADVADLRFCARPVGPAAPADSRNDRRALARLSLEKRFGVERWRQYAPVLLAGMPVVWD